MPHPSASLSTLRPDLADSLMEFELAADRQGFIATDVAPVMEVAKQAGTYGLIPIEQLLANRDTSRAPGSGYARGSFDFTSATFACMEHGAEEVIDDREAAMYANFFDAEQIAAARALDVVLRNAEKRMAAAVFNATTWTSYTTGITNEWNDPDNAVPITDVEAAAQSVFSQCGMWPNALIINMKVFRNLRNVAQVIDRIKFAGIMDPAAGNISAAALAQVLAIDKIIIAGSAKKTSIEGATLALSDLWDDEYAMVAKVATTNDPKEPCIARTFHWGEDGSTIGGTVETYRDETVRGDVVRVRHDVDEIIPYVEAGHLLSNITS